MRTITINLPTSIKEFRMMLKEKRSKRYQHNIHVLHQFAKNIIEEVCRGYWQNDISPTMKNRVFNSQTGKIVEIFNNAKNSLK